MTYFKGGRIRLRAAFTHPDTGRPLAVSGVVFSVVSPSGETSSLTGEPIGGGTWEASFVAFTAGKYEVGVLSDGVEGAKRKKITVY